MFRLSNIVIKLFNSIKEYQKANQKTIAENEQE